MKRERKLNFGQLCQVEEKVKELLEALREGYQEMEEDIWWNMKQIRANLVDADDIASGWRLDYYSDIDTTLACP